MLQQRKVVAILKCHVIAKVDEISEQQWLDIRKRGIGGSDAGAVCGVNKYKSPLAVYLEKTGQIHGQEDNEALEWGRTLEPIIKRKFAEKTSYKIEEVPFILQHPAHPWMIANIDGIVITEGGSGVLEVKNAGEFTRKEWSEDRLPDSYYLQLQHYLEVTGLQFGIIVCLLGGKSLVWKEVPRDEEIIRFLIDIESKFWSDVEKGVMPSPTGSLQDKDILQQLYSREEDNSIADLSHLDPQYHRYKELMEQRREIDQEIEEIKQKIMAAMGQNQIAYIGKGKVTWKNVKRKCYVVKERQYREFRIW